MDNYKFKIQLLYIISKKFEPFKKLPIELKKIILSLMIDNYILFQNQIFYYDNNNKHAVSVINENLILVIGLYTMYDKSTFIKAFNGEIYHEVMGVNKKNCFICLNEPENLDPNHKDIVNNKNINILWIDKISIIDKNSYFRECRVPEQLFLIKRHGDMNYISHEYEQKNNDICVMKHDVSIISQKKYLDSSDFERIGYCPIRLYKYE